MWVSDWGPTFILKKQTAGFGNIFSHDERDASTINSNFLWDMLEDKDGTLWFWIP
jgi:hypothetical protein